MLGGGGPRVHTLAIVVSGRCCADLQPLSNQFRSPLASSSPLLLQPATAVARKRSAAPPLPLILLGVMRKIRFATAAVLAAALIAAAPAASAAGAAPALGTIRLAGSPSPRQGQLQVQVDGEWMSAFCQLGGCEAVACLLCCAPSAQQQASLPACRTRVEHTGQNLLPHALSTYTCSKR